MDSNEGFWVAMIIATITMGIGNLAGWWTLSWWVVFAPIWLPYAIALSILGLVFGFIFCVLVLCFIVGAGFMIIENNERDDDE